MNIPAKQFFQLLSGETRLRCLLLMQQQGELCVCELTHALGQIQPKISRHLATLRDAGVVADRRQGQRIYYRIHPDLSPWSRELIESTAAAVSDRSPFSQDLAALLSMPDRPTKVCCA